jgi:hypothetical protein
MKRPWEPKGPFGIEAAGFVIVTNPRLVIGRVDMSLECEAERYCIAGAWECREFVKTYLEGLMPHDILKEQARAALFKSTNYVRGSLVDVKE